MAKIVDPDSLTQEKITGAPSGPTNEVSFDTTNKRIYLNAVGNLVDADGCTLQALYSFCKEEWKNDADLIKLPFPFEAITEVKYDVFNGWDFGDTATRNRIRDGGWSVLDASGNATDQYFGFITLGTMVDDANDRAYYQNETGGTATDAVFPGPVNEPVRIFDDPDGEGTGAAANFDYRSVFNAFLREQGKTYSAASLAEQAVLAIDYTVYKLPLANATDPKIVADDATVQTGTTYLGTQDRAGTSDGTSTASSTTFTSAGTTFVSGDVGKLIVITASTATENIGRYEIVTFTDANTVELNKAVPGTASDNTFNIYNKGITVSYLDGQGFTTWANATTYNANDVVQSGTDGRWYITAAGGTSSGDDTNLSGGSDTGVTWTAYAGERDIGGTWYAFDTIVDANSQTAEPVYEFTQWRNRAAYDINDQVAAGSSTTSVTGRTAPQLLSFLGDTLITGTGVFIDNFNTNDTNRIEFNDVSGTARTFPFVAAGTINFNANLQNDAQAVYWMFFKTNPGGNYGTTNAIIVDDNDGIDITGSVPGASVGWTFDYDNNTQGGRSAGTDADVVIVAIGLETAQFVSVEQTITRNVGQNFSLVSNLERNYSNPA